MKFEALDKELQDLLYSPDTSKLISVLKEGKKPLFLEQISLLDLESCKHLGFPVLWSLYEDDFIPFEEDFLIEKFADALYLLNKHKEIESFILKRPRIAKEIGEKLPSYFLEKRDISVTEYEKLLDFGAKGFFKGSQVLPNFLEALLSPMKTYTANTYCRIIESCKPTAEELLPSQHTLFALLSSDKTSVINFVIKLIKQIADEKAFDFQSFADNFALCFATPKIAKSQLIGLGILENHYKKQVPSSPNYREQLAVLFTVPDAKLQEKVASLLTTYFRGEGLAEVVAPYEDYLKIPTPVPPSEGRGTNLNSTQETDTTPPTLSPSSQEKEVDTTLLPLCPPSGKSARAEYVEGMLFLLGDCLRERTAATIDLFFEGLVQLQDQLPENFKEQLAPYITQVNGMYYTNVQLAALQLLLAGWVEDRPLESPEDWTKMNTQVRRLNTTEEEPLKQAYVLHNVWYLRDEIPYLLYKVRATLSKLKSGNKLPFLSTPTYAPFYIDADTLADRLLAYQTTGKEVDLDDLVVACNRLLLSTITPEAQEKVRSLSGQYAPALGYLFGLSDVVTPTEELLPLWTQITRLKHPNKVFTEFEATAAKDYLSAVKPFFLSYEIDGEFKQFFLEKKYINSPYNDYQRRTFEKEEDRLPYNYYNAGAFQIFDVDTLRYTISLNPQYVDVLLVKYTPSWVGVSDAETYRNLRELLQMLLEYDLPVHHGGWIFVGMALLHDKKETRDLAAEYILRAISRDEDLSYLQHFLADILAQKLTPINRFVEFLDIPTRDPNIKAFQKAVVEAYLPLAEKQEKKPTNHKKLVAFMK